MTEISIITLCYLCFVSLLCVHICINTGVNVLYANENQMSSNISSPDGTYRFKDLVDSYHGVLQWLNRGTQCHESGVGRCSGPSVCGHCPANQLNTNILSIEILIMKFIVYVKDTRDPYHDILQWLNRDMFCYGSELGRCREPSVPGHSPYNRCYICTLEIFISYHNLLILHIYCKMYVIECAVCSAVVGFARSLYSNFFRDYIINFWPFFINIRTKLK